jgi:probable rRNA maturation factor
MPFHVDIQNEHGYPADAALLRQAALQTLAAHDLPDGAELTVALLTDEAMRTLNRQHRGVDAPTDVLSFPTDALPDEIDEAPYLGDVLIGYAYVEAQSAREGFPLAESLALMVVHGVLHLLGYDHDIPSSRAEMWQTQAEILTQLGIRPEIVLAYEQEEDE